jgi:hypothetical protein
LCAWPKVGSSFPVFKKKKKEIFEKTTSGRSGKKKDLTKNIPIYMRHVIIPNLSPHMHASSLGPIQIPLTRKLPYVKTKTFLIGDNRNVQFNRGVMMTSGSISPSKSIFRTPKGRMGEKKANISVI